MIRMPITRLKGLKYLFLHPNQLKRVTLRSFGLVREIIIDGNG